MNDLREKLLSLEAISAARQEKLQEEIQNMFQHKLTRSETFYWAISFAGSAVFVVAAAFVLLSRHQDSIQRMIWGGFGIVNLFMTVYIARLLLIRRLNVRHQFAMGKILVAVTLIIVLLVLAHAIASPSIESLIWAVFGVTWLVIACTIAVHNRIVFADMNAKEQALRLEYRLAELAEKVNAK